MLSSAQRAKAPLLSGTGWPVRLHHAAIFSSMCPARWKSGASGSMNETNGFAFEAISVMRS